MPESTCKWCGKELSDRYDKMREQCSECYRIYVDGYKDGHKDACGQSAKRISEFYSNLINEIRF